MKSIFRLILLLCLASHAQSLQVVEGGDTNGLDVYDFEDLDTQGCTPRDEVIDACGLSIGESLAGIGVSDNECGESIGEGPWPNLPLTLDPASNPGDLLALNDDQTIRCFGADVQYSLCSGGAITVLFDSDQEVVSFDIATGAYGIVNLVFYGRDGTRLEEGAGGYGSLYIPAPYSGEFVVEVLSGPKIAAIGLSCYTFSIDNIRFANPMPRGRCAWGLSVDPAPARNIDIRAFFMQANGVTQLIPSADPTQCNEGGYFCVPPELVDLNVGLYPGEVARGLCALYEYSDQHTPTPHTVVTYAGLPWSPETAARPTGSIQGLANFVAAIADLPKDIHLAPPVLFQPGWGGGVEVSGGPIGEYLRMDQGQPMADKGTVPTFPLFIMPNSSEQPWGYDNEIFRHNSVFQGPVRSGATITRNADRLRSFYADRVLPELQPWVGGGRSAAELPFLLVGHSYGGPISRAFVARGATPERYATLDAVHGGVQWDFADATVLDEGLLNGCVGVHRTTQELLWQMEGWNHGARLGTGPAHLLYASVDDLVVRPNASAFGIGRLEDAVLRGPGPEWRCGGGVSNHCVKVFGGWEVAVEDAEHSLHMHEPTLQSLGEWLAYGRAPTGATSGTPHQHVPSDCQQFLGAGAERARNSIDLVALAGGSGTGLLAVDEANLVRVSGVLSGDSATVEVVQAGSALPKMDVRFEDLDGDQTLVEFAVAPTIGAGDLQLRLDAGATQDAQFVGAATLIGRPHLVFELAGRRELNAGLGGTAYIDNSGAPLVGSSATVSATITAPDGSQSQVPLADDGLSEDEIAGDGIYGFQTSAFSLPGTYAVHLTFDMTDPSLGRMLRSAQASTVLAVQDATISNLIGAGTDVDGNGLFENVEVAFDIDAVQSGTYRMSAIATHSSGASFPLHGRLEASVPGVQQLSLGIPSAFFVREGSGNVDIVTITLTDDLGDTSFSSYPDSSLGNWQPSQFEAEPGPSLHSSLGREGPYTGGNWIHVLGEHLFDVTEVLVGDQVAIFERGAPTMLRIQVPGLAAFTNAAGYSPPTPVDIRVTSPYGTAVLEGIYTYK